MSDIGVLRHGLRQNMVTTIVSLPGNGITNVSALGAGLEGNSTVEAINLRKNRIAHTDPLFAGEHAACR